VPATFSARAATVWVARLSREDNDRAEVDRSATFAHRRRLDSFPDERGDAFQNTKADLEFEAQRFE
jgi:hypothetical protein